MTFSLAARCPDTGAFGLAVCSSSPAVAARCAWVRAGAGAVASQNVTDPGLGLLGLDLLARGIDAPRVVDMLVAAGAHPEHRQITAVDDAGRAAYHSGARTLGLHAVAQGRGCIAAGNLLADEGVPRAMVAAFAGSGGERLAERLVRALEAGLDAGGEAGEVRSAGLLVALEQPWPIVDLRVDWHDAPIAELRVLWAMYAPQVDDYVARALDPEAAPAYGVPGDP